MSSSVHIDNEGKDILIIGQGTTQGSNDTILRTEAIYAIYFTPPNKRFFFFFLYLGFLSRTFTIHGTAGEGGGYLFNSSLPLPPASQALRH